MNRPKKPLPRPTAPRRPTKRPKSSGSRPPRPRAAARPASRPAPEPEPDVYAAVREHLLGEAARALGLESHSLYARGLPKLLDRTLTPRQLEVVGLVAQGLSTHDIARRLRLSDMTVHTHREVAIKRLGLRTVADLVRWAISRGLVSLGSPAGPNPHTVLSARELQVLRTIASGASRPEVAKQLGISPRTFDSHRLRLLDALRVRTNAELVLVALRHGLVPRH
jgi:DNA-binding CsgD family transcriptional regulator